MYKIKVVGLENRVSELVKQVTGEKASGRTAGDVTRVAEVEKSRLAVDLLRVRTALEASQELAARTSAAAKVRAGLNEDRGRRFTQKMKCRAVKVEKPRTHMNVAKIL